MRRWIRYACFVLSAVMLFGAVDIGFAKEKTDAQKRRERERKERRQENRTKEQVRSILEASLGELSNGQFEEIYSMFKTTAGKMEEDGSEFAKCVSAKVDVTFAGMSKILPEVGIPGTVLFKSLRLEIESIRGRTLMSSEGNGVAQCEKEWFEKLEKHRKTLSDYFVSKFKMTEESAVALLEKVGF